MENIEVIHTVRKRTAEENKNNIRPLRRGSAERDILQRSGVNIMPIVNSRGLDNAYLANIIKSAANALTEGSFYTNTQFGIQVGEIPKPYYPSERAL